MNTPINLLLDDPTEARELLCEAILQPDPLLFVDRAAAQGVDWIVTEWTVPSDPALFRGDENARILPGTLCCEHVVQSGELLIFAIRGDTQADEGVPVLTRLRQAKFRRMVRPGQVLKTRVKLVDQLGPVYRLSARVTCEDERVLDVDLDFSATTALAEHVA